ncbi:glycoside hydrolase family 5 protein [Opitutaceae bacterium TAV4]|nr:glycoside hydrolase family 5 protein [Opitutaceae bacterium TAV4]RRK00921.1 glycoside hydrolase family 5 protein [Opitutaceae bacterium TAV3]
MHKRQHLLRLPITCALFLAATLATLAATIDLIPNGNIETADPTDPAGWPDKWPRPETGVTWEKDPETGNRFLRLASQKPGEMIMIYTRHYFPKNTPKPQALELAWRERLANFKRGAAQWHDARIMIEFLDATDRKITDGPAAKPKHPFTNRDTKGWVQRKTSFLVPDNAAAVVLMYSLFEVQSGTLDLDDLHLTPADPAQLEAAAAKRAAEEKARYVPDEAPDKSKWPPELHVSGNKILTPDGREILLRGLSTSGMETLYQDQQGPKTLLVAVEQWKANILRLPIRDDHWFGQTPGQKDGGEAYRRQVDKILTLAANRGAYLLIDLHRFRAPRPEHAAFWTDVATRYKNHPAALFDIFNEPHGMSWEVWRDGGQLNTANDKEKLDEDSFLTPEERAKKTAANHTIGMQALVKAVRDTGAKNLILASGLSWSYDLTGISNGYALDDLGGNGIVYSWHAYNWHRNWISKLAGVPQKHPILVAEFGADVKKMDFIPLKDQEDPYTWAPDMLGFIQNNNFHYTAWCFHPAATPVLISDWNYTPTPFWGAFAKRALAGEKFEMKRER